MRNSMKKIISQVIPLYSVLPILLCVGANVLSFYGTRLFNTAMPHFSLEIMADRAVPFVPAFITVYIAAYAQWVLCYIFIAREGRDFAYRYFSGLFLSKLLCAAVFLILPTAITRPEITGTDIFSRLTAMIYSADTPDNLFPSVHCLESVYFAIVLLYSKKLPDWAKTLNAVFSLFVCASVVFVKQHFVLDIFGGAAVAFLSVLVARGFRTERLFYLFLPKGTSFEN